MMAVKRPGIVSPRMTLESIHQTVTQLQEHAEGLAGQRGPKVTSAVTFQDLIDMGLITAAQVPK